MLASTINEAQTHLLSADGSSATPTFVTEFAHMDYVQGKRRKG